MADAADQIARPRRLALLIDAENASPRIVTRLFEDVAALGEASVRRAYGDFSGTRLKGWTDILATHAIIPHHNLANTAGKNAADIALVIDAMDLLHTGRFDAFCLVSSDGDFTRLAARIREQGVDVHGFGEGKTPESFRKACKRFVCTEGFGSVVTTPANDGVGTPKVATTSSAKMLPSAALPHIRTALSRTDVLNGWYPLSAVGICLHALVPGFDPKAYGCDRLVTLIEQSQMFQVRRDSLRVYIKPHDGVTG